jgi:hypothetical protein
LEVLEEENSGEQVSLHKDIGMIIKDIPTPTFPFKN